jgi:hypothetical protein
LTLLLLPNVNVTHHADDMLLLLLLLLCFVQLPFEDCKTDADCELQASQLDSAVTTALHSC